MVSSGEPVYVEETVRLSFLISNKQDRAGSAHNPQACFNDKAATNSCLLLPHHVSLLNLTLIEHNLDDKRGYYY